MEKPQRPAFEVAEATLRARSALEALGPGETIPYAALAAAMGCDPQLEGRHNLDSARRSLLKKLRRVYEVVPGEGVKHLTQAEVARLGPHGIRRTNRMAKRWARKLDAFEDDGSVPEQDKQARQLHAQLLSLVAKHSDGYEPRRAPKASNSNAEAPRLNLDNLKGH